MSEPTDPNNNPNQPDSSAPQPDDERGHDHDHDHSHGHDHHHDSLHPHVGEVVDESELDPGGRALSGALRLAFRVLSWVMWFVLVLYVISGSKKVDDRHVGVKVWLGELNEEVLQPGGPHFWFPKPLGQIVLVPTTVRELKMENRFMPEIPPGKEWKTYVGKPLKPGVDGYLLTGDRNIVHAKWTIKYHIPPETVLHFLKNVGMADPIRDRDRLPKGLKVDERPYYWADQMVLAAAERAIVKTVATVEADRFLGEGLNDSERSKLHLEMNQALRKEGAGFESGLRVTSVSLTGTQKPKQTEPAFDEVSAAKTKWGEEIDNAETAATKILSDAAGTAHEALVLAIDFYDRAREAEDTARIEKGEKLLRDLLKGAPAAEA
ncbi:MAG: SPFH domain-containing protein, partial [Phycisphaeraceae bacterium]|nr:SPFH domain-containing protein [Phycisphaeraceae bacterium]